MQKKDCRHLRKCWKQSKKNYETADNKMKRLKAEGKEKSATYRQLMGNKLQYQHMLSLYKIYGLIDGEEDKHYES